ncbi:MAG: hypothetical protein ACFFBI_11640 [Promethearchaeota archaeon]
MESSDFLLGLIFSSEDSIIYDKIELSTRLSDKNVQQIKQLPMRFLGPFFMALAYDLKGKWNISFIESTLSSKYEYNSQKTLIQSFICLNSSLEIENQMTQLFGFVGSPYTEDPKMLFDKMNKYIHQSIIQGKHVNQRTYGIEYDYDKLINGELQRGINLINHSLRSPRKMYWEERKQQYYAIAIIERNKNRDSFESNLYTFDIDDPLRLKSLAVIPSYYLIAILPDYFENRIVETLELFEKTEIYPNIRRIKLNGSNREVLYIEEYLVENQIRNSFGLILIPRIDETSECHEISFFKKKLRLILDKKKNFEKSVIEINPRINPFEKWSINSDESLKNFKEFLDNKH